MTQKSLNEFIKKVDSDERLRTSLEERFGDMSDIPSKDLIAFADEQGYDFTVDEVKEDLSDSELEGVSGGTLSYLKVTYDPVYYDVSATTCSRTRSISSRSTEAMSERHRPLPAP